MNVIIVDESIKKSKTKARRIISDYLQNIGRNTWIGSITENALSNLRQRLLSEASSKNLSVACFKITTRRTHELVWIAGSKACFDEEGNFAFRYKSKDHSEELIFNDYTREIRNILSIITEIAGLFHDVGKNYYAFQNKLYAAKNNDNTLMSDPIRHEKISYDVFLTIFLNIAFKNKSILEKDNLKDFLIIISQSLEDFDFCSGLKPRSFGHIFDKENSKLFKNFIKMISHLILSHHKIPREFNDIIGNFSDTVLDFKDDIEDKKGKLITHYENVNSFKNYKNKKLIETEKDLFKNYHSQKNILEYIILMVKKSIDKILEVFKNSKNEEELLSFFQEENLIDLLHLTHYILRPSLIIADQYYSSIDKCDIKKLSFEKNSYANLKNNEFNQSLETHLKGVSKTSRDVVRFNLNCIIGKKSLNSCDASKEILKKTPLKLQEKFGWQDSLKESVENNIPKDDKTFGYFGVVMGKTGSGKTRANAKLMSAINNHKDLRFSVVLGMKSLTLQTYDEYKNELHLNKTVGVIGDNQSRSFHEKNKEEQNLLSESQREDESIKLIDSVKDPEDDITLPDFLKFKNQRDYKLRQIMSSPITVSTIDYFINSIDTNRSSKTRFLQRIMTSDLIIDEIDSFSETQSVAICKLIYLSGMYGRKVIISSATTPKYLINIYKDAYLKGYEKHCLISGRDKNNVYMGIYTHFKEINETKKVENLNIDDIANKFKEKIKEEKAKRRVEKVDVSDFLEQKEIDKVYDVINEKIKYFHNKNKISHKNMDISTGLVKFANTRNTVDFTKFICNTYQDFLEKGYLLKIECYHSKNFTERKSFVEKELHMMLNRKNDKENKRFLSNPRVSSALKEAEEKKINNVIFLVISSPLIEVGRDFDFDWGIIEPRGHRDIIQTAGRILRHREFYNRVNCGILSHSLKLFKEKTDFPYSNPGSEYNPMFKYQTDCKKIEKLAKKHIFLNLKEDEVEKDFYNLFEYKKDGDKIDASVTIDKIKDSNPIKRIEDSIESFLKKKEHSFYDFLEDEQEFLTSLNSYNNIFRNKEKNEDTVYYNLEFDKFETEVNKNITNYKKDFSFIIKNRNIFIIPESLEEINEFYKTEKNKYDIELEKNFYYSDLLGFYFE